MPDELMQETRPLGDIVNTHIEDEQTQRFASAVGRGLSQKTISDMQEYVQDAQVHDSYKKHSEVPFIYEIMIKPDWNKRIKEIGCAWIANEVNLQRAAKQVGRSIPSLLDVQQRLRQEGQSTESPMPVADESAGSIDRSYLLRGFCIFSLKAKAQDAEWATHRGFLGCDKTLPQTVVFIALEDLNAQNGFIMSLRKGDDVCMDSQANIEIPRNGGGRGIYLALNL